jgi:hypothetical protein
VLLLVNSFLPRSDFWEENFDYERVSLLFQELGVTWDMNYMSDEDRMLPAKCGDLTIGYGQGGRVKGALPEGAEALLSCEGDTLGFRKKVGRGEIAVIGDAGLVSNGLYGFPTFDNRAFILGLIDQLLGAENDASGQFALQRSGMLSCATSEGGVPEPLFRSLLPEAEFRVDHHYRHLLWEKPATSIPGKEDRLPFAMKDLRDAPAIRIKIPRVAIQAGGTPTTLNLDASVSKTVSGENETYFVSGNLFEEGLGWSDIGADPAVFGKSGELCRVNTVVQYIVGLRRGELHWATAKHGQILYARNPKEAHYGGFSTILLGSDCAAYSPVL